MKRQAFRNITSSLLAFWLLLSPLGSLALIASVDPATLPTGGSVVHGNVVIDPAVGDVLNIHQNSQKAIINWQDFSIGSNAATIFHQVDANAVALNRVVGGNLSEIYGTLQANGKVFLINPNGVVIGAGGLVDTNGFLAATHNISDSDFLNDNLKFLSNSNEKIINEGTIEGGLGDVYIIAREIVNKGTIRSGGAVALAADMEVLLVDSSNSGLVVLFNNEGSIDNQGKIDAAQIELKAAGGNAYALAINNDGIIRAIDSEVIDGRVVLISGSDIKNTGKVSANGKIGGDISILSEGRLEMLNDSVIEAIGAEGKGGNIDITAEDIHLVSGIIDASGQTQGGRARIGGEYQGGKYLAEDELENSNNYVIENDVLIKANTLGNHGDGGEVTLWSDGDGEYFGKVEVLPGSLSGEGGFVEVSAKRSLYFSSGVNTGGGTLLIDPIDLAFDFSIPTQALSGTINVFADNDITLEGSGDISGNVEMYFLAGRHIILDTTVDLTNTSDYDALVYLEANSNHSSITPGNRSDNSPGDITFNGSSAIDLAGGATSNIAQLFLVIEPTTGHAHGGDFQAGNLSQHPASYIKVDDLVLVGQESIFSSPYGTLTNNIAGTVKDLFYFNNNSLIVTTISDKDPVGNLSVSDTNMLGANFNTLLTNGLTAIDSTILLNIALGDLTVNAPISVNSTLADAKLEINFSDLTPTNTQTLDVNDDITIESTFNGGLARLIITGNESNNNYNFNDGTNVTQDAGDDANNVKVMLSGHSGTEFTITDNSMITDRNGKDHTVDFTNSELMMTSTNDGDNIFEIFINGMGNGTDEDVTTNVYFTGAQVNLLAFEMNSFKVKLGYLDSYDLTIGGSFIGMIDFSESDFNLTAETYNNFYNFLGIVLPNANDLEIGNFFSSTINYTGANLILDAGNSNALGNYAGYITSGGTLDIENSFSSIINFNDSDIALTAANNNQLSNYVGYADNSSIIVGSDFSSTINFSMVNLNLNSNDLDNYFYNYIGNAEYTGSINITGDFESNTSFNESTLNFTSSSTNNFQARSGYAFENSNLEIDENFSNSMTFTESIITFLAGTFNILKLYTGYSGSNASIDINGTLNNNTIFSSTELYLTAVNSYNDFAIYTGHADGAATLEVGSGFSDILNFNEATFNFMSGSYNKFYSHIGSSSNNPILNGSFSSIITFSEATFTFLADSYNEFYNYIGSDNSNLEIGGFFNSAILFNEASFDFTANTYNYFYTYIGSSDNTLLTSGNFDSSVTFNNANFNFSAASSNRFYTFVGYERTLTIGGAFGSTIDFSQAEFSFSESPNYFYSYVGYILNSLTTEGNFISTINFIDSDFDFHSDESNKFFNYVAYGVKSNLMIGGSLESTIDFNEADFDFDSITHANDFYNYVGYATSNSNLTIGMDFISIINFSRAGVDFDAVDGNNFASYTGFALDGSNTEVEGNFDSRINFNESSFNFMADGYNNLLNSVGRSVRLSTPISILIIGENFNSTIDFSEANFNFNAESRNSLRNIVGNSTGRDLLIGENLNSIIKFNDSSFNFMAGISNNFENYVGQAAAEGAIDITKNFNSRIEFSEANFNFVASQANNFYNYVGRAMHLLLLNSTITTGQNFNSIIDFNKANFNFMTDGFNDFYNGAGSASSNNTLAIGGSFNSTINFNETVMELSAGGFNNFYSNLGASQSNNITIGGGSTTIFNYINSSVTLNAGTFNLFFIYGPDSIASSDTFNFINAIINLNGVTSDNFSAIGYAGDDVYNFFNPMISLSAADYKFYLGVHVADTPGIDLGDEDGDDTFNFIFYSTDSMKSSLPEEIHISGGNPGAVGGDSDPLSIIEIYAFGGVAPVYGLSPLTDDPALNIPAEVTGTTTRPAGVGFGETMINFYSIVFDEAITIEEPELLNEPPNKLPSPEFIRMILEDLGEMTELELQRALLVILMNPDYLAMYGQGDGWNFPGGDAFSLSSWESFIDPEFFDSGDGVDF